MEHSRIGSGRQAALPLLALFVIRIYAYCLWVPEESDRNAWHPIWRGPTRVMLCDRIKESVRLFTLDGYVNAD